MKLFTSRISFCITRSILPNCCWKPGKDRSLFAHSFKQFGLGVFCDVVSDHKDPVSASSLGMDNPLRDTFAIKLRELINQVVILDEDRTELACSHGILVIIDRMTLRSSQQLTHFLQNVIITINTPDLISTIQLQYKIYKIHHYFSS